MFAPRHHAAMAHVVPVRKELGVRTIFNFLGPLTNPAGATRQLLGVSDRHYQETIAEALVGLGSERAMVVAAEDGLDELSLSSRTRVIEVADGAHRGVVRRARPVRPRRRPARGGRRRDPGRRTQPSPARCSTASAGPQRDLVLLNAGAAIYVGGLPSGLEAGVAKAAEAIDSGAADGLLERLDRGNRPRLGRLGSRQLKWE